MAKALKCDRCGGFFDYAGGFVNYQIRNMNSNKVVDLCPECYTVFTKWLTGEKPQSDPMCGTGELYPGEFESRHYEFEEESDGSSGT